MSNNKKIIFNSLSKIFAICIVIVAFHLIALQSYAAWTSLGLSNTQINMVVVDPTNANIIYAIANNSIYKTTDGGATWNSINNGLPNLQNLGLSDIAFDPQNSSILYAVSWADNRSGGQPGVWKTTDGGANWTDIGANIGTSNPDFKSIAIDPHNPNTVFVGSGNDCNGVWKTTDGGTTWSRSQGTACDISGLAVDPNNSNIVYATEPSVYKSTDGGVTFTDVGQGGASFDNNSIVSIAVDPNNSNNLYAGPSTSSSPYMYKSTDAGATWTAVSGLDCHVAFQRHVVITDPIVPDTVYLASSCQNVDRSTDGGTTWSSNNLLGVTAFGLYAPASIPGAIYAGTTQGVYVNQFTVPTSIKIVTNPSDSNVTVGTPFNIDVKVNSDSSHAFNAAQATVTVSSNLSVTGIHNATSNACNFQYTKHPTKTDPSFAGAIYGNSSTGCTVYTMTLTPTSTGTGTVAFTNASIKSYADNSEILTGTQDGSYTIGNEATSTPTAGVNQLTVTSPLETYYLNNSYTLSGTKDAAINHVFINGSETGVTFPTSTTWQAPETLNALGANNIPSDTAFTIYGGDGTNQTATQTINVSRHTLGDINGDGVVDLTDASLFAVDWDKTSNLTYVLSDMNADGNADLTDLSILAKLEQ